MNYKAQLAQILATIAAKQKQIGDIMTKSVAGGHTPSDDDEATITVLEGEIARLEKNAERLQKLIKSVETAPNPTEIGGENPEQATASATGEPIPAPAVVQAKNLKDLEQGVGFAMLVKASAIATKSKGSITTREVLESWNAPDNIVNACVQKAVIGTTSEGNWGQSLTDYTNLTGEFIELVRHKTFVDKIAKQMRQVPFNIKLPTQTASGSVGWVGEGKRKPVGNPNFGSTSLSHAKIAGIVLLSDELIRFSNPKADQLVRDDLVNTVAEFIDNQFFDPDKAEATESPASVLNGVVAITATGTTADKVDADLTALIQQFADAGISLEGAVWGMSESRAVGLAGMRDALGRIYFEGMNLTGSRSLKALPVHTCKDLADKIVLIVPSQILLADDGGVDFSVSTEATINMGTDDEPNFVNLFENNLTGIRAERFIRWKKRHAKAVGFIKYED